MNNNMEKNQEGAYSLLAMDMDDTALSSEKVITPKTARAISEALDRGKIVIFCTGRSISEMKSTLQLFPKMRYLVCESGGLVYDIREKKVLFQVVVPEGIVRAMRETSEGRDVLPVALAGGVLYANAPAIDHLDHYQLAAYMRTMPLAAEHVKDVFAYMAQTGKTAEKINIFHTSVEERELSLKMLREKLAAYGVRASIALSEISSLECSPEGVDKGSGLRRLSEILDIPVSKMIMVGDGDNDMGGLRTAGLAVAMGNAIDEVKEIADVVVADNNHDGCAEAIYKYLLD